MLGMMQSQAMGHWHYAQLQREGPSQLFSFAYCRKGGLAQVWFQPSDSVFESLSSGTVGESVIFLTFQAFYFW